MVPCWFCKTELLSLATTQYKQGGKRVCKACYHKFEECVDKREKTSLGCNYCGNIANTPLKEVKYEFRSHMSPDGVELNYNECKDNSHDVVMAGNTTVCHDCKMVRKVD